jgi:hypothetical protein
VCVLWCDRQGGASAGQQLPLCSFVQQTSYAALQCNVWCSRSASSACCVACEYACLCLLPCACECVECCQVGGCAVPSAADS